jgi:hypothetical protein
METETTAAEETVKEKKVIKFGSSRLRENSFVASNLGTSKAP